MAALLAIGFPETAPNWLGFIWLGATFIWLTPGMPICDWKEWFGGWLNGLTLDIVCWNCWVGICWLNIPPVNYFTKISSLAQEQWYWINNDICQQKLNKPPKGWLGCVPYSAKILSFVILLFSCGVGAGWLKKLSSSDLPAVLFVLLLSVVVPFVDAPEDAGGADRNEVNISSPDAEPFVLFWLSGASVEKGKIIK